MNRTARGFAVFAMLVSLASSFACVGGAGRPDHRVDAPKQFQPRQVIVTLASPTLYEGESTTHRLSQQYDLNEAGSFPLTSIRVHCAVFQVPVEQRLEQVMQQLRADPRVDTVETNQAFEVAITPQDTAYTQLEYAVAAIHADAAHQISTGKGVRVAMVDTGVDTRHPALLGHVTKSANFVEGGELFFDHDRHGTAVAGIIGAGSEAAGGFMGIAPEAEILAAKACWYTDRGAAKAICSSWTLAKAIDLAINSGTQVLNLSLSGPFDDLLARLLQEADSRGITVVAAAAEEGPNVGFPAVLPTVVPVVASDPAGQVSPSGPVDQKPSVAAPGVDILTTAPDGRYDVVSGSSLAAAHVTGVVALLLQQKATLTPREIRELLQRTAHPIKRRSSAPAPAALGLVDACSALNTLLAAGVCS